MPGSIHCRPDGGDHGEWIKLGWAFNAEQITEPVREPELNPYFPEVVLRAASRLQPKLAHYLGALPRDRVHYGGYYPMTRELATDRGGEDAKRVPRHRAVGLRHDGRPRHRRPLRPRCGRRARASLRPQPFARAL
ncbi:hypothetical protein [Bradyrhizobium sp. BR 1433]|uniref:hypothetical protein n=1 Tax=Bradyrhizobium sp. BR 1433 TaxID=3447967 RepID=UPI003EE73079